MEDDGRRLRWTIAAAAVLLTAASAARHALFASNAWDLAIFDQGIWLLSRGLPAVETVNFMHILADHGALIHLPTALLYRLHPDVHWLFAIQAAALALGAWPVRGLARETGLAPAEADLMAACYLLYPLVLNMALFDYHPEVVAVPALLAAALEARRDRFGRFALWLALALSTKEAMGLTVAAMGAWLALFDGRRRAGLIALALGLVWFAVVTTVVMPAFDARPVPSTRHWHRFDHLGATPAEALANLVLRPGLWLRALLTAENLFYLVLLAAPLGWGLRPRHMAPLVAALPALGLNLLSSEPSQKNVVFQYAAPILPFLMIAAVDARAAGRVWPRSRRGVLAWAVVAFLALAKFGYFGSIYLAHLDSWRAARAALALIPAESAVLTAEHLAPHLAHRRVLHIVYRDADALDAHPFDHVLLALRHPGDLSSAETLAEMQRRLAADPRYEEVFAADGIHLHARRAAD